LSGCAAGPVSPNQVEEESSSYIPSELLDEDDEEAHWLFSTAYRLTTTDISLAGFTSAILLDAARWKPHVEEELSPEDTAAAEVAYTFGFPDDLSPPTCALPFPQPPHGGHTAYITVQRVVCGWRWRNRPWRWLVTEIG
jgi:hypothetical protein